MSGKPLITFIIPTIGRSTLSNTLESLINQTNPNWKAIVIFDGVSSTIKNTDRRISVIESSKLGKTYNSAGVVRNYGITLADTEWVAFVDDDDCLLHKYVDIFIAESSKYSVADIIIFRMVSGRTNIMPQLSSDTFYESLVGISFAAKKKLFDEGHVFISSITEAFTYLNGARQKHYNIMISPHITYFVRQYDGNNWNDYTTLGNRVCMFNE